MTVSRYRLANGGLTFPQIVDRKLKERPDDVLVYSVGEGELTWRQLDEAGNRWAARLAHLKVGRQDVVANLGEAGLGSVACWLGLCRLGAIEAAINTEFRGRMLAYAINNVGARVLLANRAFVANLEPIADDLKGVEHIVVTDGPAPSTSLRNVTALDDLPVDLALAKARSADPQWHDVACITYTSGTTGPSKAVRLPWGQLQCINLATYPHQDLGPNDVILSLSSNAHFGSKSMPYLAAMIGGKVVMRRRFSGAEFWDDVKTYKITTCALIGSMIDVLNRQPNAPGPDTSLRNVFMAPVMKGYEAFNARYDTRVCTAYSSTENGVPICSGWNPPDWRYCGRLRDGYPGFEVRIVDENDIEVPDGQLGEAIVRSSVPWTMNDGYHNNAEATARAWRNGWYHTGDGLIRLPDGWYQFVDRMKDAIRRRGENISSFEVEADVMANRDVLECAAVAVPADQGGEDEILLCVVPKPGSNLTPESLLGELTPRMTRFMVPRYVEFMTELPRTDATRRVKKHELRARGITPTTFDREKKK